MKKILTLILAVVTLTCFGQDLNPLHPVVGSSKLECTRCDIHFRNDNGAYYFLTYRPAIVRATEGMGDLSSSPSLIVTFPVIQGQRYLISLALDPFSSKRIFHIKGPGNYAPDFTTKNPMDEDVELFYTPTGTGISTLQFSTDLIIPWRVKNCKIETLYAK
ncbi:MAG: hypothetical protein ABJB16_16400 [Saprospiraceae bacterium]